LILFTADHEERSDSVADASGVVHGAVEAGHERSLVTLFGEVTVDRLAYRVRSGFGAELVLGLL
jgi:hypothetical protein